MSHDLSSTKGGNSGILKGRSGHRAEVVEGALILGVERVADEATSVGGLDADKAAARGHEEGNSDAVIHFWVREQVGMERTAWQWIRLVCVEATVNVWLSKAATMEVGCLTSAVQPKLRTVQFVPPMPRSQGAFGGSHS